MTTGQMEPTRAIDLGRDFFHEVVRPAIEEACPELLAQAACGRFGLGSECLGLDDAISRDHHWGPRVDMLFPEKLITDEIYGKLRVVSARFPTHFRGFPLEAGHVGGPGIAPEGLNSFLRRSVGRTTTPESLADWLDIPEEDIVHVINGEVWHDAPGEFTRIRAVYSDYYPEPVWKRRIAHWCRYASGMGLYPIRRAVLRGNLMYAFTAFGRCVKLTVELTFLLNRTYFPYDKWLYPMFRRLPKIAPEMDPLLEECLESATTWERRIELLERAHALLDTAMVTDGIIKRHARYVASTTAGYRLLEHAYQELIQQSPEEIRTHVPLWDQRFLEEFHSGFVNGLTPEAWDKMLNLQTGV
ncbi:MAG: DUF4037 domain-containing protein [Candidatus Hydrogenedentes bacterium]|nr:DUF4037 domain-containing protein [Candidatus Hydrogenedentota bacterium]